jgi:hypothetical protein
VLYRYPVARLTFPDGTRGDGPDRYSLFQAAEGTAMLILRPVADSFPETPCRSAGSDSPNPAGPVCGGPPVSGGPPIAVLAVRDGDDLDAELFRSEPDAPHAMRARYRVPTSVPDERVVEYLSIAREIYVSLTTLGNPHDDGDRPRSRPRRPDHARPPDPAPQPGGEFTRSRNLSESAISMPSTPSEGDPP